MTQPIVNVGSVSGDHTGDGSAPGTGQVPFQKVNSGLTEAFSRAGTSALRLSTYPWNGVPTIVASSYAGVYGALSTSLTDVSAQLQAAINVVASLNAAIANGTNGSNWSGSTYELIIDLPIYCKMDMTGSTSQTMANTVFIPAYTVIRFVGRGLIFTDGIGVPLFCMVHATDVHLRGFVQICYIPSPIYGSLGSNEVFYNGGCLATFAIANAGSGYTPGTYNFVPMALGSNTSLNIYLNITVGVGGTVTAVAIASGGAGLSPGNTLTVQTPTTTYLPGGSGFSLTVSTVSAPNVQFFSAVNNWNNFTLLKYMSGGTMPNGFPGLPANLAVSFSGGASPIWAGPTNGQALIQVRGNCTRIYIPDTIKIFVPDNATCDQFPFCVWNFGGEWLPGPVSGSTVQSASTVGAPNEVRFGTIIHDGVCMGMTGACQDFVCNHFISMRYSDLNDSVANDPYALHVGGVGTWSAPPHASYMVSYSSFYKASYVFKAFTDKGIYYGPNTRRNGPGSGFLNSLKIELANNTQVGEYFCQRPDGALQFYSSQLGYVTGQFKGTGYIVSTTGYAANPGTPGYGVAGFVFPSSSANQAMYDVDIDIKCVDTAPVPGNFPIGSDGVAQHQSLRAKIGVQVADWPNVNYTGTASGGLAGLGGPSYTGTGWQSTSGYASGEPGFGFGGQGVQMQIDLTYNACTNTTATYKYIFGNSASYALTSGSTININLTGYRACASNFDALKPRLNLTGGVGQNLYNSVTLRDSTNAITLNMEQGQLTETYTVAAQCLIPTGTSSFNTGLVMPAGFGIKKYTWAVGNQAIGQTMGIGWSGGTTAIAAAQTGTANQTPNVPAFNPIALASSETILLTTTTGTTSGTGALTFTVTAGGSGYPNGTYYFVPMTGGSGTGLNCQVTVVGNTVTAVIPEGGSCGTGYAVNDVLSAANSHLGGAGSGLSVTVASIGSMAFVTVTGERFSTGE